LDVWLTNQEQSLLNQTKHLLPDSAYLSGWINGNLYMPAGETVGILPIVDSTRMAADIQTFTGPIAGEKLRHTFLAKQQKTRYAVISVHTTEEKKLFKRLMQDRVDVGQGTTPDWRSAVETWNQSANGKTIFYKVSKQFSINIYAKIS
jgi:hypothetical protein